MIKRQTVDSSSTPEEIMKMSSNLVSSYPGVEERLGDRLVHFSELLKTDIAAYIYTKQDSFKIQLYPFIMDNG